ncbi:MAG: hypothetical protein IH588_07455 [Anaerolineales bacterium]|nr:hypothetical protein [Anaerolineales bacterium]
MKRAMMVVLSRFDQLKRLIDALTIDEAVVDGKDPKGFLWQPSLCLAGRFGMARLRVNGRNL